MLLRTVPLPTVPSQTETSKLFNIHLAKHNLSFEELQTLTGLSQLDRQFQAFLPVKVAKKLKEWRSSSLSLAKVDESNFMIELGRYLNQFLAELLEISEETNRYKKRADEHQGLMLFKERFIQRGAKRYRKEIAGNFASHHQQLLKQLDKKEITGNSLEDRVTHYALQLEKDSLEEEALFQWGYLAMNTEEGQALTKGWVTFKFPNRLDHTNLVKTETVGHQGIRARIGTRPQRKRDGFTLTDPRMGQREIASEIDYCIYCHEHEGDFCSIGFPEKKKEPELGFRDNPLGGKLYGCPLEQKISEMHLLERDGLSIGALAMMMVDNPTVPATGHRICNDCMTACIYQKQDPVDIPQIETAILVNVLELTWGVELYLLLTRWNPLKKSGYLPKNKNGHKVLVVGLGPAGFTMAHYLSQEGCYVAGVDGLKLEPLPEKLLTEPVKTWQDLEESLESRILYGFGGVAEYGITVRWDKNFLKLIYLMLGRRENIDLFGGVRLGGTFTLDDAFQYGFDHVSLAVGAGLPRVLTIKNSLARGMRQASDFLMAMQLTGAAKKSSLANLQIRLPAVVIGGGLTAVDTATEVQAYYIHQVEKVAKRAHLLGEATLRERLNPEDNEILTEFLTHAKAIRRERERATKVGESPNFYPLLKKWGGVMIAYRKTLEESPAYRLNHQELTKALEEGIFFAENLTPEGVLLDEYGHINAIQFSQNGLYQQLPARAVLVAAGTSPNTIYATEYPGSLALEEGNHFQGYDLAGEKKAIDREATPKDNFSPFTSYRVDDKRVSYIGDAHPTFNGSVVKAIASSKRTYPLIMTALSELPQEGNEQDKKADKNRDKSQQGGFKALSTFLQQGLTTTIRSVTKHHSGMTEVWVKAPIIAKNFQAGQFFRLQTYEALARFEAGTQLQIPLITVSGTGVKGDLVRLLVFPFGTGQKLIPQLKKGEKIVLAGPMGAPTDLPKEKTILVMAGRWGAAVMLDIGLALKEAGNKVIYLALMKNREEVEYPQELEAATDQIIWCVEEGELIPTNRVEDKSVQAQDIVTLLKELQETATLDTLAVDRLMAMGSTSLLQVLQQGLSNKGELASLFRDDLEVTGTIGSPMQCMMKGVCGQCLQWQIDPKTGERTEAIFTCACQDQPLKKVDLDNLSARTSQNRLLDILSSLWLDKLLAQEE